jgi:PAS domain S-box-containing protein
MLQQLQDYFSTSGFMPHGHCYLWKPELVALHVISDALIGIAYVAISLTLALMVRRIRLPFSPMFMAFGVFILACGVTHFVEIYTLWIPQYWFSGFVKLLTATASIATAFYLLPLIPRVETLAQSAVLAEERRIELIGANDALERKIAERTSALSESEQRFRQLANLVPQLLWRADRQGRILFFNDRWYEYTGFDEESPQEIPWHRFVHPDDLEPTVTAWNSSLRTGEAFEAECRLRRSDGSYCWHLSRAVATIDDQGQVLDWFGTSTDINDQKLSTEALEKTSAELHKAVQVRDEFLSVASHELRTPLTPIKLQLQLSQQDLVEARDQNRKINLDDFSKSFDVCIRQLNHLTSLIDSLLDVSRIQAGRLQLNFEAVDMSQLVADHVERDRPQFEKAGCELHVRLPLEALHAKIDKQRITQVLDNLLSNAMKYGAHKPVVVSLEASPLNSFSIRIKDEGVGIEEHMLTRVFDRFERAGKTREITGLGLGLYISKQIVLAHHGNIRVESTLGRGSEFVVEIPLKPTRQT